MKDEITISLRALTEESRKQIEKILDKQLEIIPDETNQEAVYILNQFNEK